MSRDVKYRAPTSSARLDTLDVLSLGLSLDIFRQGQVWQALELGNRANPNALHATSILPTGPCGYPITGADKDTAYDKRKSDALELGLKNFLEKWPIPTVTVVRGWTADHPKPRVPAEAVTNMLTSMVNRMRGDAGLHWHGIRELENGIVCSDTPEGLVESLFQLFERTPDLPAVLVYGVDGFNMAMTLSDHSQTFVGAGTGPRQPGELTDAMVALVVGRPERVDWLRYYAPFTQVNENPINPEFTGWGSRQPTVPFQPSPFIPKPWTVRAFQQWDALPVLAKLYRPVTVSLQLDGGKRLMNNALHAALAAGWGQASQALPTPPARVFFDTGESDNTALTEWIPALNVANSPLDLLASDQSYNLTQRLGDTGAVSPFVSLALATMASYLNGDSGVVMPLRRTNRATLIPISSPTPGQKPPFDPFGVRLMPQHSLSDGPDPIFLARQQEAQQSRASTMPMRFIDPEQVARDQRTLDDFLASGPGVDLTGADASDP